MFIGPYDEKTYLIYLQTALLKTALAYVYTTEDSKDSDQPVHERRLIWVFLSRTSACSCVRTGLFSYTIELQWLEHLRNHENTLETRIVRGNEC